MRSDFSSLILRTYELFNKYAAFAKRYRTVYPYVCVDEFQDTNIAQYSLLKAILGEVHKNIFIVADDDQIIYQWNGASHKRLEEFANDFKPSVIQLPVNYRCPAEIVDLANNLIGHNFLRSDSKAPLQAARGSGGDQAVRLMGPFDDFETEAASIAEDIKDTHGRSLGEVVVLARNRKLLYRVVEELRSRKVTAGIAQRKDEFESTPFVWLHGLLRLANDRQDRGALDAVCGSFRQLTGIECDADEIVVEAEAAGQDLFRRWLIQAQSHDPAAKIKKLLAETKRCLSGGNEFLQFCELSMKWFDEAAKSDDDTKDVEAQETFALYDDERAVWIELRREIIGTVGDKVTLEAFLAGTPDAIQGVATLAEHGAAIHHSCLKGKGVQPRLPRWTGGG